MPYTILTGANDAYINTLIGFIENYVSQFDANNLIVYNLGLNDPNKQLLLILQQKYNFALKTIDYTLYPEHVDLSKYNGLMCSYAFKPIIIYNEATNYDNKNKIIIWMDSANRFTSQMIESIYNITKTQGFYSPISNNANTIESIELSHPETVSKLGLTEVEHKTKLACISANLVAFNYFISPGMDLLNDWYNYSLDKSIIIPEGSSRNNHRQDQTILSILVYLYEKKNNIIFEKPNLGVSFWNKVDVSTIDNGYYPFRLFDKHTNIQLATIYCKNREEAILVYSNRKLISKNTLLESYIIL
jgi:hypothetical protein